MFRIRIPGPPEPSFSSDVSAAVMLAASIAITGRRILLDSHDRCSAPEVLSTPWFERSVRILPGLIVLTTVGGMFVQTAPVSPLKPMLIGAGLALLLSLAVFGVYHPVVWKIVVLGMDVVDVAPAGKARGVAMLLAVLVAPAVGSHRTWYG